MVYKLSLTIAIIKRASNHIFDEFSKGRLLYQNTSSHLNRRKWWCSYHSNHFNSHVFGCLLVTLQYHSMHSMFMFVNILFKTEVGLMIIFLEHRVQPGSDLFIAHKVHWLGKLWFGALIHTCLSCLLNVKVEISLSVISCCLV